MNALRKLAAFIAAKRQYIAQVVAGQSIWATSSWLYDNPLYITAVAVYGPLKGGALMTFGSLVICWGMVLWYNKKGVDWLGIGAVDSLREISLTYTEKLTAWRADSFTGKILFVVFYIPIRVLLALTRIANHKKHGDIAAFFILSIFTDPFMTTAYLRHGVYGPMQKKEWAIFFGSVLFSNFYWILRTTAVVEIAKAIWNVL